MAKHFELAIADASFAFARKTEAIAAEAARDGVYVIRSSLPADGFEAADLVLAYKGLGHAERGFCDIKSATSTSARSTTAAPIASAPTSSCACSPTTWSGA